MRLPLCFAALFCVRAVSHAHSGYAQQPASIGVLALPPPRASLAGRLLLAQYYTALRPHAHRASVLEQYQREDAALEALRRRATVRTHDRPPPAVTPRVLSAVAGVRGNGHADAAAAAAAMVAAAAAAAEGGQFERTATV